MVFHSPTGKGSPDAAEAAPQRSPFPCGDGGQGVRSSLGVFDSGVGGLSVLRHLRDLLPAEDILYVADSAWCPYGPKPAPVVRRRAGQIVATLRARGVKLVVVACNSASTIALADLRRRFPDLPLVGMEPAVKPAAAQTRGGALGVLATAATAAGESLARLIDRFGRGVAVHVAVPEGLVELVERGQGDSPAAEALLWPILSRWQDLGVDVVVLGCTHYPFARAAIERLAGPHVAVVDPGPAVARQAARVLRDAGSAGSALAFPLSASERGIGGEVSGTMTFLTSGEPEALRKAVERLMTPAWAVGACFGTL
ncbi:MAG: glutamate racemase [Chloroflexota bacterium]